MSVVYVSGQAPSFSVGRDPEADLVLEDTYISRRHLLFTRITDDVALVEVLGTNGARVRGTKVNKGYKGLIRAGDCVCTGSMELVWTGRRSAKLTFFPCPAAGPEVPDIHPVEIEGPPPRKVPEKPSLMLAAGPALSMAIPILLGAGRTIAVLSSVFAAVWAVANVLGRVRRQRLDENRRKNTYLSYISECEETINTRIREIASALGDISPPIDAYLKPDKVNLLLWRGHPGVHDNLLVRTGTGPIENPLDIVIPRERFAGIDDSLKDLPGIISKKYKTLPACPVLVNVSEMPFAVYNVNDERDRQSLSAFILNLCAAYSPERVSVFMNVQDELKHYYMWMTWLPHYKKPEETGDHDNVIFTDDGATAAEAVSKGSKAILIKKRGEEAFYSGAKVINGDPPQKGTRPDMLPPQLCYSYAGRLSALWGSGKGKEDIPDIVPFGRLTDDLISLICSEPEVVCERLSDGITRMYGKCDVTTGIRAPIGIREGGIKVFLDIHEKGAGPHGLIAGTTGSGKSELLATMILSYAIRYPPEKLSFFLIDYKGGGMSNLFANLPHLLGNISNLTRSRSLRAMTALKSENVRRQELFAKCGVNNINDYTRLYDEGLASEALPHIVVIVDEFAELRKEEPEFMDRLISISQVGRSLGMHLLLATQKPAGVVDEKIRSNTGFRIALRLVDRADSMDMLHAPDAAGIKKCGRAFLQVASDEALEVFQSAYAMAPVGSGHSGPKIYTDFFMEEEVLPKNFPNAGTRGQSDGPTWYDIVMRSLAKADLRRDRPQTSKLWLPPLSADPVDEEAFAIFDDPSRQRYVRAIYNLKETGNVLVAGRSGSGKTELLHTLICRSCNRAAVYIVDFGGGRLKEFGKHDFCGAYIDDTHPENIVRLTGFIDEILTKRRKKSDGCKKESIPLLIVFDNMDDIRKSAGSQASEHIRRIITVGKSAGIYIAASTLTVTGSKEEKLFDTTLLLGNEDRYVISAVLGVSAASVPVISGERGRGIGVIGKAPLEFQTVRVQGPADRSPPGSVRAEKYPYVPDLPSLDDLLGRAVFEIPPKKDNCGAICIPAGYEKKSGKIYTLPFNTARCVLISGKPYCGRHTLLFSVSVTAARYGIDCVRADTYEAFISFCRRSTGFTVITTGSITKIFEGFYQKSRSREEEDELISYFENPHSSCELTGNTVRVIGVIGNDTRERFFSTRIYEALTSHPYALVFGGHLDENRIFDFSYLPYSEQQKSQKPGCVTILKYDEKTFSGDVILPVPISVDNLQSL